MNSSDTRELRAITKPSEKPFSLSAARKAFFDLEGWTMSEEALALAEHEVEAEMEDRGREAMHLMLQAHMNRRDTGNVGPALRVVRQR